MFKKVKKIIEFTRRKCADNLPEKVKKHIRPFYYHIIKFILFAKLVFLKINIKEPKSLFWMVKRKIIYLLNILKNRIKKIIISSFFCGFQKNIFEKKLTYLKKNKKEDMSLSVIFNFHKEGFLLEETIKNFKDVLKEHSRFNLWTNIEIIAILDRPDILTKEVFYKNSDFFDVFKEVDFGDLSLSRNIGVDISKNSFILFSDGDDFVSPDCLNSLYFEVHGFYEGKSLKSIQVKDHIIFHPRYVVEFPKIFISEYVNSNKYVRANNTFYNSYTSKIMGYRTIFESFKFRQTSGCYGYEDWDLNNRLMFSGIRFVVVDFILFYRKEKENSLLFKQLNNSLIVRNSSLYSNFFDKKYKRIKSKNKQIFYLECFDCVNFLKKYTKLEIKNKNENINSLYFSSSSKLKLTSNYEKLLKFFKGKDILFFSPWVVLGGADKLLTRYSKSINENSIYRIGLVTDVKEGERIKDFEGDHLNLNTALENWSYINDLDRLHVLVKAIVNSKVKMIHIVNSDTAFKIIKYYNYILKENNIKIFTSLFCPDYDWSKNEYSGYPVLYPEIFKNSDCVFSDNEFWVEYYKKKYLVNFFYKKLYSPVTTIDFQKTDFSQKNKILWASRICNQKLIPVLEKICLDLPNFQFVIYGSLPDEKISLDSFERILKIKNVKYMGFFKNESELNPNEYDLYLYTSLFDGIPNSLVEIISLGIPVVSADVGGIKEIFPEKYNLLVKNPLDHKEYVNKILDYYRNKDFYLKESNKNRERILLEHNYSRFSGDYLNTIDFFINPLD